MSDELWAEMEKNAMGCLWPRENKSEIRMQAGKVLSIRFWRQHRKFFDTDKLNNRTWCLDVWSMRPERGFGIRILGLAVLVKFQ